VWVITNQVLPAVTNDFLFHFPTRGSEIGRVEIACAPLGKPGRFLVTRDRCLAWIENRSSTKPDTPRSHRNPRTQRTQFHAWDARVPRFPESILDSGHLGTSLASAWKLFLYPGPCLDYRPGSRYRTWHKSYQDIFNPRIYSILEPSIEKRIIHGRLNISWKICSLVVNCQSFLVIDGYLLNLF